MFQARPILPLLLFAALAASSTCWGQDKAAAPEVALTIAPPQTPYHRTATLTITATLPDEGGFTFPEVPAKLGELELRAGEVEQDLLSDGRTRLTKHWTLDAPKPLEQRIAGLVARDAEGNEIRLPAVHFIARELTDDEREAAQIFAASTLPAAVVEEPYSPLLILLLAIAIIAALGAAGWWYLGRRAHPEPEIIRAPWEVAMARLEELQGRALPAQGRFEPYYVDLSAILRYYIEDRFHLRAPEQTTQEFLEAAATSGQLSNEQQEVLAALLRHSDRVKFARYEPSVDDMERSFNAVRWFVEETIPRHDPAQAREAA